MSEDDEIFEVFLTEFDDFVTNLESEHDNAKNGNETNVYEIFRAFHTFKGNGALFELNEFVDFSDKYTEHFRSIKEEKSLSPDNVQLLEKLIGELKVYRAGFKK